MTKFFLGILIVLLSICHTARSHEQALQYLDSLSNYKNGCIAKANENLADPVKAQLLLAECYKGIILDLAQKFYPGMHFGQDLEGEINTVIEQHHRLLYKMAHCPLSKNGECQWYEQADVLSGTVNYLNQLIEFMVLNIGEGYAEFHPEQWLKRWDAVS